MRRRLPRPLVAMSQPLPTRLERASPPAPATHGTRMQSHTQEHAALVQRPPMDHMSAGFHCRCLLQNLETLTLVRLRGVP